MDTVVGFVVVAFAIAYYFLPVIVASHRKLASKGPLVLVNLYFGWTIIGWFVCLLWAALGQTQAQADFYARAGR